MHQTTNEKPTLGSKGEQQLTCCVLLLPLLCGTGGVAAYDLLVAADVFVYIGDLQPVLAAAASLATDRWVSRMEPACIGTGAWKVINSACAT